MGIFCIPLICGCVDNQRDLFEEPEKPSKDEYFDFDMNQSLTIDVDYGFKNEYAVLFEIYDQIPVEVNNETGTSVKKSIEPIYRATTDKYGKFNEEGVTIPSSVSEVWLSSDYLGAASPVKIAIGADKRIFFNQDAYIQSLLAKSPALSRGITTNEHKYLDDWTLLPGVDWDDNGRPNNLSAEKNIPPASVLYNIKSVFNNKDGKNITNTHPEFFDGNMISDIPITKETEVSLVFVNSTAGWYNTVGYYTYPTGKTPTVDNIKKIMAFPNASPVYKSTGIGALVCGDEVKLKYWNEDKNQFEDKFPAGVTIGWCLQGMGFRNKPLDGHVQGDLVTGMGTRYSTTGLNEAGKDGLKRQRTVSLREEPSNQIVAIGFEDNIDLDYCDAIFYIHIAEKDAIDEGVIPPLPVDPEAPPTDEDNYTVRSGTLLFEDLWPEQGDYDMNDVMIRYTSKVYKSILTNRVYKIVDEYTPFHRGGYLANGFGYQLHNISNSDVSKITIESPSYTQKSQYMSGDRESGQSHPTILLFDDMLIFNGKEEADRKYTVTIQVNDVSEKSVLPPYNPFIFVESDKTRGREVHLVKYPPTDKANLSLLGTGKDASRPDEELYYVSVDLMPFALNMPVADFPIPEEGVRIDESYPQFATWVKSNGKQSTNWYKYPKK